jgi:hypothetical protein
VVTLNGELAPTGILVTVEDAEGTRCGDFVTGEGATFELILASECRPGVEVRFRLDTGDTSSTQVSVPSAEEAQPIVVEFVELSTTDLQALGVVAADEEGPVVGETPPSPPLTGRDLYVVVLGAILPALGLLFLMAWLMGRPPKKDTNVDTNDRKIGHFRRQIEGLILVMVVLAIILLGVTDKIGSDGLVSVLAAIVGYTIGRQGRTGDE